MTSLKPLFLILLIALSSQAQSKPEPQAEVTKAPPNINRQEQTEPSLEALQKAVRENPNFAEAHFKLGLKFLSADTPIEYKRAIEDANKAIEEFQRAVALKPDFAEAYFQIGRACFRATIHRKGDLDEQARKAYLQAIRIKPDYAEAYNGLGWTYLQTRNREQAINAFNKAIHINPRFADAYDGLGTVYRDMGKYTEAVAALKEAAELGPKGYKGFMILSNLQSLYEQLGRYAEAIEVAEKAITRQPNPISYFGLGDLYLKVGRTDDAIAAYKKGISIKLEMTDDSTTIHSSGGGVTVIQEPGVEDVSSSLMRNMIGRQRLGELYVRLGRYADAVEPSREEIRDNPKNSEAYRVLRNVYLKLKMEREAVETAEQWVEALPDEPRAYYELGSTYLEAGDKAGAMAVQKKLAELAELKKNEKSAYDWEGYAKMLLQKLSR